MLTADVLQGFVGSVLAHRFDGSVPSPECHREWWELCCDKHPNVAIAAPRGHAKSTAITLSYGLAALLFREASFVVIVSDTEAQSINFVGLIKAELQENDAIHKLFGKPQFIKESETDIIVRMPDGHKFRVIAKGAEQKLRGLLWNGRRPDLLLCDDLENDEIVMNQDRRHKFKRWFYGALLPSRSKGGKVRYVGTILHMDSMLENLMPITWDKQTIQEGLKTYSLKRGAWKSIKYAAHNEDFSIILWPDRFAKEDLISIRQDYRDRGIPEVYSQEYLNVPIDESVAYFKRGDFLEMREEDKDTPKHFYMTCDLAISEKQTADYSAFCIAGVDENRRIHVVDVIKDRMDGKEIVDLILQLDKAYNFHAIGIEEGQISKAIGPFLREEMVRNNQYPLIYPLKSMGKDKLERSRSIQGRMRAKTVKFDKEADWFFGFQEECIQFPRSKHDDQVDAFSYLGIMLDKLLEAPTIREIQEEEYEDELRRSNWHDIGRDATTGY